MNPPASPQQSGARDTRAEHYRFPIGANVAMPATPHRDRQAKQQSKAAY